ncbi:sensor histidine kinase [Spirosoma sp. KNUC1025]|uniref:sensor histidine kinase n=1 Tax=Spirosoma sp. KNUC1025 TaxID=2894082 RepID=UPI00386F4DA7|nr:sensor histidine kinase [Spirosoma sp. KNUC1025]
MQSRSSRVLIHIIGGLAFLALPYFFTSGGFSKLAEVSYNPHEQRNLVSYLLTIGFFYANYYGLIPRFFFTKKYVPYALSVVGSFVAIQVLLVEINKRGIPSARPTESFPPASGQFRQPPPHRPDEAPSSFFRRPVPPPERSFGPPPGAPVAGPEQRGFPIESSQTFFLFALSFLLSLMLRTNDRLRETEREKLQTELSFLKAQINPHFLFNTLNSIYSLAIEQSSHTADAIIELSSFLRYITKETNEERVSLSKELAYIGHYVALQKLRLADTVQLLLTTTGSAQGAYIAPLILISFIENAFKYGVNPQEDSIITIAISIQGNELHCRVFNKKVHVTQSLQTAGSGIGLTNTKARLNLLYPNQHRLLICDTADDFTVDLFLTLS